MAQRFVTTSQNATDIVLCLRSAFQRNEGIALTKKLITSYTHLADQANFVRHQMDSRYNSEEFADHDAVLGAFARYLFLRLPVILSARINGRGRPSIVEIEAICKHSLISFEKAFPGVAKAEIENDLFEEFSQRLSRCPRWPPYLAARYLRRLAPYGRESSEMAAGNYPSDLPLQERSAVGD